MSGWDALAQGNNQTKVAEIVEDILEEPVIAQITQAPPVEKVTSS